MLRSGAVSNDNRYTGALDIPLRDTTVNTVSFALGSIVEQSFRHVSWLLVIQSQAWCRSSHCERKLMAQFAERRDCEQFGGRILMQRRQYTLTIELKFIYSVRFGVLPLSPREFKSIRGGFVADDASA